MVDRGWCRGGFEGPGDMWSTPWMQGLGQKLSCLLQHAQGLVSKIQASEHEKKGVSTLVACVSCLDTMKVDIKNGLCQHRCKIMYQFAV